MTWDNAARVGSVVGMWEMRRGNRWVKAYITCPTAIKVCIY